MNPKHHAKTVDRPGTEYTTPELIVHGDLASLTAGPDPGSADIGAQTSTLPGDNILPE